MEKSDILALTVLELKSKLSELNLSQTGRKQTLQDRLLEHYGLEENEEEDEEIESVSENTMYQEAIENRSQSTFTLRDIQESLNYFDGTGQPEVDDWINEFEENAHSVKWSDLQKFIYAKQLIKGAALAFIKSQTISTWAKLRQALKDEFTRKRSTVEIHRALEKRRKNQNESFLEYLYSLIAIAKPNKIDEHSIIDYFIEGINDSRYSKSVLYEATSIEELKIKIKIYEKIRYKSHTSNQDKSRKKCLNCPNLNNHHTSECKKASGLCFKCNGKGHKAVDCKAEVETKPRQNDRNSQNKNHTNNNKPRAGNNTYNRNNNQSNNSENNTNINRVGNSSSEFQTNICNTAIRIYKTIQIKNHKFSAILDTGSDVSLITNSVFEAVNINLCPGEIVITGIGNGGMKTQGYIVTNIKIDNIQLDWKFYVVNDNDILYQSIIGNDILGAVNINLTKMGATFELIKNEEPIESIHELHEERIEPFLPTQVFRNICMEGICELEEDNNFSCSSKNREKISQLIQNYRPFQTLESPVKMNIILNDETPIYQNPRRIPHKEQKLVENQIEEWSKADIIRESNSEFAAPIVLVNKKDGSKRLCCDFRKINEKIIKDNFPMILIDDVLLKLQNAKFFSTLDLKNGFFHVEIEESSRKYTAFVTHHGQFEFNRMPFGMKNSPAIFCRFIASIFRELVRNNVLIIYMDDIVIPSQTEEENIAKLTQVLELASKYGLEVNWKKCQFLKKEIHFLGYEITNSTIKPSTEKTQTVSNYKIPTNVKSLQRFLGLTSYFRRFIDNYAVKAKPLTKLLIKDTKFMFKEEQQLAFLELKQALMQAPILRIYNPEAETEVHTDASCFGYGAVLFQKASDDQNLHPVEYMSRQTSPAEQKYDSYELEVLAIIGALKKWRIFLLGIPFKIITDCNAFTQTLKKKEVQARIARWIIFLQDYNFTIEHRAGSKLRHVDALSRVHSLMLQSSLKHCIIQAQKSDDYISLIREILKNKEYKDYYLKNEVLYKDINKEQIVIPAAMENEIINIAHKQGHFGFKKTKEIVEKNFYIKDITKKVETFIQNCIQCILSNEKLGKKEGWLNPIDKSDKPLQTLHIDHLGPLETTKKQYNFIFTVVDAFSKFVWIYPTKSTTSEEVIDRMTKQAAIFGNPARIISDRGTAFTSNSFREYCRENNIEHQLITTGLPRANGQVERVHRIILSILTKLCVSNKQQWYKHTNLVQQIINNTPTCSTKFAPFKILTGLNMKITNIPDIKELLEEEMIKELENDRNEIRIQARENIQKIQEENRNTFNRNRKIEREYEVDQLVAIKRTQFGPGLKIKPKYLGPYKIVKKKRMGKYVVEKVGEQEGPIRTQTTAEFMKPWSDSGTNRPQDGRM